MSTIADRIKEICAQKETSMYKLEKQLNLGNGTIGKWGKTEGNRLMIKRLLLQTLLAFLLIIY